MFSLYESGRLRQVVLYHINVYQFDPESPFVYFSAPQKTRPCDKKDKNYCLNNGTCNIMVELNQKFCTYVDI